MPKKVCETCTQEFDQDKHLPRYVNCGCVRCELCLQMSYNNQSCFKCPLHNSETITQIDHLNIAYEFLDIESIINCQQAQRCDEHTNELQYYCQTDKVEICDICIYQAHRNHPIQFAKQKIVELKQILDQTIQQVKQKINQRLDQIKATSKSLVKYQEEVFQKIIEHTNKLQKQIRQASKSLQQERQSEIEVHYRSLQDINQNLLSKLNLVLNNKNEGDNLQQCNKQIIEVQELLLSLDSLDFEAPSSIIQKLLHQDQDFEDKI